MEPIEEKLREIESAELRETDCDPIKLHLVQALRFAMRHWGPNIEKDIVDILDGKVKE